MSRKRETSKQTVYHEITIFKSGSSQTKQPDEGLAIADSKNIYFGQNAGWRYPWKKVEQVEFEGRDSLIVKCNDVTIQCDGNTDKNFPEFRDYALKMWHKRQGKKQAKEGTTMETTKRPSTNKRRSYGSRSYAKPRVSLAQPTYYSSSEDEKENTKPSWKEPEEPEEVLSADEEENEFNDGESPPGYDENPTPEQEPKKKHVKRRLLKKSHDNDDDSDEDMFDDPALTTPASKHLVSPANANDDSDDDEASTVVEQQPDTATKGNQSIKNFFAPFAATNAPSASSKAKVVGTPKKKPKASPFSKAARLASPTRVPLKQDNSDWLAKTSPPTPSRSKFFPVSARAATDSDIESPVASPLPSKVQEEFFGKRAAAAQEGDDIVDSPPSRSPQYHTSGVVRGRFKPRARRPGMMSPLRLSPKRSSADEALSSVRTPKRIRTTTSRPTNPYSYEKSSRPAAVTPKASSPWRGLRNLGNTCYMNSSLQLLFCVPKFVSSLAGQGKDLAKSLLSVSNDVKDTSSLRSANPNIVKKAVDAVTDKFEGYEQRDAHEFLSDLVDRVHDELEEERKESGVEVKEDTPPFPTDEYFRMNVQVCLTCDSCGYARTMEEMYRHLSIDVEDENGPPVDGQVENISPWSVQQGIDQFFAPENREIRCEKCKDGTTATQTLRILSRPKALLLHLKRFVLVEKPRIVNLTNDKENASDNAEEQKRTTAVEMAIRKNKSAVALNPTVSLGPIVPLDAGQENVKDGPMAVYDVKGVAHHIGTTAWSGHYTCDAIRESDSKEPHGATWVSFDDGLTSATTEDKVLKSPKSEKTAYMLLYTLKK